VAIPVLRNPRFASCKGRRSYQDELDAIIAEWTASREAELVAHLLQNAGIAAGVVQDSGDLARDGQLAARRFFVSLDHPVLGSTLSDRSPLFLEGCQRGTWKAAPLLGEDNRHVFVGYLGLSDEEFQDYSERGIIG